MCTHMHFRHRVSSSSKFDCNVRDPLWSKSFVYVYGRFRTESQHLRIPLCTIMHSHAHARQAAINPIILNFKVHVTHGKDT